MIKSELVQGISERNPHLYLRDVEKIVNAILDEITKALTNGDRVELQATNTLAPGASLPVSVAVTTSGGAPLTTALFGSRPNFLDSIAWGLQGCFAGTNATPGAYLQLSVVKTNGATVLVGVTNAPGNTDFPAFFNQFKKSVLLAFVAVVVLDLATDPYSARESGGDNIPDHGVQFGN